MPIYILDDPRDDEVRYVGQSKYTHKRYNQHVYNCDKGNLEKSAWIAELKALGLTPGYYIVEDDYAWSDRFNRERYWINFYLSLGHRLTNQLERKIMAGRDELLRKLS